MFILYVYVYIRDADVCLCAVPGSDLVLGPLGSEEHRDAHHAEGRVRDAHCISARPIYVSLEHTTSLKQHIFVEITNNTLCRSKLYIFILCQNSLDIKIMFHEDILYRKYIKM